MRRRPAPFASRHRFRAGTVRRTVATLVLMTSSLCAAGAPLDSVGQLLIPAIRFEDGRRRHFDERCSATVVTADNSSSSRWILTAWHCLEYYGDLSRDITFLHGDGSTSKATTVASGGGLHADWALMRLTDDMQHPVALTDTTVNPGDLLVMAGFSRSADGGTNPPLESDLRCKVTAFEGRDLSSNCHARRGASGGAVFSRESHDGAEKPGRYLGIISRGDSNQHSIFVPLNRLARALSPYLALDPVSAAAPPTHPPRDQ